MALAGSRRRLIILEAGMEPRRDESLKRDSDRTSKRAKHYWVNLLGRAHKPLPEWIAWPAFFSALERVWIKLNDARLLSEDPLLQSSELRQLMIYLLPSLQKSGFNRVFSDNRHHLGESYLQVLMADMRNYSHLRALPRLSEKQPDVIAVGITAR